MVTYVKTTYNQLETPSGAVGEAPDGPGAFQHLAANIDTRLGIGGAEYAANLAAITAIPASRTFDGKLAYAADTKYLYRWVVPATGTAAWRLWQTPWATISPLGSGIVAASIGYPPAWKIVGGDVQLGGMLTKASAAAFADADALLTVPAAAIPAQTTRYLSPGDGAGWAELQLAGTTGALTIQSVKGTTVKILALDAFGYRVA